MQPRTTRGVCLGVLPLHVSKGTKKKGPALLRSLSPLTKEPACWPGATAP